MGIVHPDEANRWLKDNYGTTITGDPLFRVIWSTGLTEKRRGTFRDYIEGTDIFLREVTEVRECLKYPFAQERWIIEKVTIVPAEIYDKELFDKWIYEGVHVIQTNKGQYLPLSMEIVEVAIYLLLVWGRMSYPKRLKMRMEELEKREREKKEKIRQMIGENMRSPLFFVLE